MIGWTKCTHCGKVQKTMAKLNNRIRCRMESCNRTFIVKMKLKERIE